MTKGVRPDAIGLGLAGAAALVALPAAPYAWYERAGRAAWPRRPPPDGAPPVGGYRRAARPAAPPAKAPAFVRLAAYSCFAFGQMLLPGLAFAALGVIAGGGAGVVALPGLWVAAGELALGRALLARAPGVAEKAEGVARASFALNLTLAPFCALGLLSPRAWPFAAGALAYAFASLAQAALLFGAARRLGRHGGADRV